MATPAAPLTPTTTVRPPDPPPHPTASSTTLPDPPQFIAVDGVYNFRDIGGYAIASSPMKSVRRHFVYRSADPSLASAPGRAALRELRVTRVFDMRSRSEIEKARAKAPPLVMDGVEVVYVPVFEHREYTKEALAERQKAYYSGIEGEPQGFPAAYLEMLSDGTPCFAAVLAQILARPSDPILLHCTAGKDRTGVIVALLLSLCGVADETIAKEYDLMQSWIREIVEGIWRDAVEKAPEGETPMERANRTRAPGKEEDMLETMKFFKAKYGSAEAYLTDKLGFSNEEVVRLREALISDTPASREL